MSGNGPDLGAVYQAVIVISTDLRAFRADAKESFATKQDVARLGDELSGLRQAVMEYHSAVIGHGVLISELDGRLRRGEQHLGLSPAA